MQTTMQIPTPEQLDEFFAVSTELTKMQIVIHMLKVDEKTGELFMSFSEDLQALIRINGTIKYLYPDSDSDKELKNYVLQNRTDNDAIHSMVLLIQEKGQRVYSAEELVEVVKKKLHNKNNKTT